MQQSRRVTQRPGRSGTASRQRSTLALHASAAFLGSALLFSLEPLVGKLLLPRLGGAPAVWNTCLLFFQGMLLAGYAYAHYGVQRLGIRRHGMVHALLLAASLPLLPPGITSAAPPVEGSPSGWLLLQLLRAIGLPFLLISATAPLVQQWFAATTHRAARDPYFLYAASNAGSLAGLALYPFALEPLLGLRAQGLLWSAGYVLFVATLGGLALRAGLRSVQTGRAEDSATPSVAPLTMRLRWARLAAVPSALLLTVTGYVTTDVAPMPLLWLLPLSLYILTFIIAFGRRDPPGVRRLAAFNPMLVVVVGGVIVAGYNPFWMIVVHLLAFGSIAYLAHATLASERPVPAQLTSFYLWLSIGGTAGGVLGVVVAPMLLMPELEYMLLLLAALTLGSEVRAPVPSRTAALMLTGLTAGGLLAGTTGHPALGIVALAVLLYRLARGRMVVLAVTLVVLAIGLAALTVNVPGGVVARSRNFFGTLRVREYDDRREMLHGRTVHGVQLTAPGARTIPTSYYGREGPLGELMALLRRSGHPARVGAIGLGAGTAGCYARPGDRWDLFEINPAVVELARDTTLFHFLADCVPGARVIVGDGRRSLSDLADARYDFLVLDAFSSDAVPVHLLTREAFSLYVGRLQPDGIIAVHISNRYLDLAPVLAANAHALNLSIRSRLDIAPAGAVRSSSRWVALARSASALQPLDARDWQLLPPEPGFRPWTDDYASLLPVLRIMR